MRVRLVLGEAALRQCVGGRDVMREQLQHLLDHEHVTVQLLEFAAEAPPAVRPFTILTFLEPLDPEVVAISSDRGEQIVDEPAKVTRREITFEQLVWAGARQPRTRDLIAAQLRSL
jgi:Domain of unknown function (DUF5753)